MHFNNNNLSTPRWPDRFVENMPNLEKKVKILKYFLQFSVYNFCTVSGKVNGVRRMLK